MSSAPWCLSTVSSIQNHSCAGPESEVQISDLPGVNVGSLEFPLEDPPPIAQPVFEAPSSSPPPLTGFGSIGSGAHTAGSSSGSGTDGSEQAGLQAMEQYEAGVAAALVSRPGGGDVRLQPLPEPVADLSGQQQEQQYKHQQYQPQPPGLFDYNPSLATQQVPEEWT